MEYIQIHNYKQRMEIYYLVLLFYMLISFFETRVLERNEYLKSTSLDGLYWFGTIALVFLIGFRGEMATDYQAYVSIFFNSDSKEFIPIEKGYLLINQFFLKVFHDYQYFLVFHAIVFYIFVFRYFKYFTHYVALASLWLFATNLGLVGSNRQLLALAVGCFGLLYYIKTNNKVVFIISICVAISFHNSAVFMFCYFFLNRKLDTKVLLLALVGSFFIGIVNISGFAVSHIGFLGAIADNKAEIYSNEISQYSYLAIFKRLVIILPLILLFREKINVHKKSNLVLNGYIFGICIYIVFGQSLNIVATRGALYFNIMEPIIITYYVYLLSNTIYKHIAIFLITLLSIVLLYQSIVQYPELYVPYKNIYFETDLIGY